MNDQSAVPDLPEDLDWVNTSDHLTLSAYRGKVVLLVFWNSSSIQCLSLLSDLRYLENKYDDGVAIVGVHVPKYGAERSTARVLKAMNRLYVRFPVANDLHWRIWRAYGVQAWPTVIALDAEGRRVATEVGEGVRTRLDELVSRLLDEAVERDQRSYEPTPHFGRPEPRMTLRFPTKLACNGDYLYVADTGRNRVLECSVDGRLMRQFGSGNPGYWDGPRQEAGFREPQGLVASRDHLYIADTGNHVIRRVNLFSGEIETLAGTGESGRSAPPEQASPREVPLNAPCALSLLADQLYIAMAGLHQIWQLDMGRGRLSVLAGNGEQGQQDGEGPDASFAQPMGLTLGGRVLFVADADGSAVRSLRLVDHRVTTLLGAGLWEFGDQDGAASQARLCHPRAVCADEQGTVVWVADSLNDRIRILDVRTQYVTTLKLSHRLHEPSGLARLGNTLFVANTNAHEILKVDLATGHCQPLDIMD